MVKKFLANDPNFLSTEEPLIVSYLETLGFKKEVTQIVGETHYLTDEDWHSGDWNTTIYDMTLGKVNIVLAQCEHDRYIDFSDRHWDSDTTAKYRRKIGYTPTSWSVELFTSNEKCDGHLYTNAKEKRFLEPTDVDGMNSAIRKTINRCNVKVDHHRKRYVEMLAEADEIQKTYDYMLL